MPGVTQPLGYMPQKAGQWVTYCPGFPKQQFPPWGLSMSKPTRKVPGKPHSHLNKATAFPPLSSLSISSSFSKIIFIYECVHMHMCIGNFRVQNMALGPLEQELQVIVSHRRSPVYNIRNKDSRVSSSGYNMTTSLPSWRRDNPWLCSHGDRSK